MEWQRFVLVLRDRIRKSQIQARPFSPHGPGEPVPIAEFITGHKLLPRRPRARKTSLSLPAHLHPWRWDDLKCVLWISRLLRSSLLHSCM